jgi:type IV secretory pathway component VirB8
MKRALLILGLSLIGLTSCGESVQKQNEKTLYEIQNTNDYFQELTTRKINALEIYSISNDESDFNKIQEIESKMTTVQLKLDSLHGVFDLQIEQLEELNK